MDFGFDYFPTQSGKFVVYDVDSLVYTEIPKDTIEYKYRIKEKIADSFTDNEGKPAIRLERYIKKFNPTKSYDSIPWTIKEVWMIHASQKNIEEQESNVRYVKLIFPVKTSTSWNGNSTNTFEEEMYNYDYVDAQETLNNIPLNKVLKVNQKNFRTLISYESKFEKYARSIGLVQKQNIYLLSNSIVPNVPVENRIESGIIYTQTIVSYGNE